ncbi:MAG: TonB-dependent receptor [Blastocatellia bacterium]|nr:TonB-dependent receptor [Blastocatellia bacterium]
MRDHLGKNRYRPQILGKCILALMVVLGSAYPVLAQNTSISGTITDPQGNAVAGATITISSRITGVSRTVTTASDGTYQAPQIAPGAYRVRVEAQGFASVVNDDVKVQISTPLTLNLAFQQVGAVTDTVTVTGGEATLNTTDATLGNSFNNTKIVELPLNARNVPNLLSLQAGVTPERSNVNDAERGGNVNGARNDQSNVTLDGVDVNEQQGGKPFFSVLRVTPDSIQEFRVTTTNANADQGRSSGAQITLVTKSGTNQFHGSLYEYHRNTVTSANDWFNNKDGVARPALLRNNFGGSIGGPIKKDKAFFFFTYEGFRESKGESVIQVVPLATLGQGIVRHRTADGSSDPTCPAGTPAGVACLTPRQIGDAYKAANGVDPGINPAALQLLADAARRYPANSTSRGDGLNTGGFRFNASTPVRQDTYIARFDLNLNARHTFYTRLHHQNDTVTQVRFFPDTPSPTDWVHPQGIAAGHSWTVSNSLVNIFRYGLTRDSFTLGGDANTNAVLFRFIYEPRDFTYSTSRVTPVHNFTDDLSWTRGNHSTQFGANIRLVRNSRTSFDNSYDFATTNPTYYDLSGDVLLVDETDNNPIFRNVSSASNTSLRDSLAAVIGRFAQYGFGLNYDRDGNLLPAGTGAQRRFATEEYELYGQDSWRIRPNLTLTYGVRWTTSTPVYETNGLQVKPTQSLADFFQRRVQGAEAGRPNNELLQIDLAGKANGRSGYYSQDWNNFAPSVSAAWSPNFDNAWLKRIFGENRTTLRGGFRMVYDRIGSALAVGFDNNTALGFTAGPSSGPNLYNVGSRLAPALTGLLQEYRSFSGIPLLRKQTFPLQADADESQRIEQSLDDRLTTPYSYTFNASLGRDFGHGFTLEASYVGRIGRNLLASRDTAHFNNLRDPKSGVDWYTAMRGLIGLREQNAQISAVQKIPYFENLFPGLAGNYNILGVSTPLTATQAAYRRIARACVNNVRDASGACAQGAIGGANTTDYTTVQAIWDDGLGYGDNLFIHPQYATFYAYSTIGTSDYHGAQFSFRKRFSRGSYFDFNYTMSHSFDISSSSETGNFNGYIAGGNAVILQPLDLKANRAQSDFDVRHLVNANFGYDLPIGRGRRFFGGMSKAVDAIFGGWKLTGIYRWNSGFPLSQPYDDGRWATNWNVQSNGVAIRPLQTSPTRTGDPNAFSDPVAAYRSYRNAYPGEIGDRNLLRGMSFVQIDTGVIKNIDLPWENTRVVFRWDTFNLTNTQQFSGLIGANRVLGRDPYAGGDPSADFGKFTRVLGTPRVMQFALRIEF